MSNRSKEVYFEEDWGFYSKKRMKKLCLGLVLLIIPPIMLYFMFFYLLYWSSLFERETALILIFLILSPLYGLFLTLKALATPRIRIYEDMIICPAHLGKRNIPLNEIEQVIVVFSMKEPLKVELQIRKYSESTKNKRIVLGRFLESDRTKMMRFFTKSGVKTGLRTASYDEEEESVFE